MQLASSYSLSPGGLRKALFPSVRSLTFLVFLPTRFYTVSEKVGTLVCCQLQILKLTRKGGDRVRG